MALKKITLWVLIVLFFCMNIVYGGTTKLQVYAVKAFISGFMETIIYGSEDGYSDFCTGEAALNEADRKLLFISDAEQNMGLVYVDMLEATVLPSIQSVDRYGTRFIASCYVAKAQHSPNGFDYYKMDMDLSVNIIEGKKKITKIYSKKMIGIAGTQIPAEKKSLLDEGVNSQLPADYFLKKSSSESGIKGTLNDLIIQGILVKRRSTIFKDEKGSYELAVGRESDEQNEYWEQYFNLEITFIKPQNNTKWKDYTKYKGFSALVETEGKAVNYAYYTVKGIKSLGKIEKGAVTWELKNCDLTKPIVFSSAFVIKEITLKSE